MNPLEMLSDFFSRRFGITYQPIVQTAFLGKHFRVIKGSLRQEADYDDGWLLALAFNSKNVIDVGCNIGQASLLLLVPNVIQRIILVDPNPRALAIAAENMILNQLAHKISLICAFASEADGKQIPFFTIGTGAAGSMYRTHARTASSMNASFDVPTVSVDWLCTWYGIIPDLVKVDVEGAEIKVLKGSTELAKKGKTKFFVEMHSNSELSMFENAAGVLEWCSDYQYSAWYLKEKVKLDSPRTIERRGRCHLLLLPNSEKFPDYLLPIDQSSDLPFVMNMMEELN